MDDEEFQPVLSSTEQLSFGKLDTAIFASIPLILGVNIYFLYNLLYGNLTTLKSASNWQFFGFNFTNKLVPENYFKKLHL